MSYEQVKALATAVAEYWDAARPDEGDHDPNDYFAYAKRQFDADAKQAQWLTVMYRDESGWEHSPIDPSAFGNED